MSEYCSALSASLSDTLPGIAWLRHPAVTVLGLMNPENVRREICLLNVKIVMCIMVLLRWILRTQRLMRKNAPFSAKESRTGLPILTMDNSGTVSEDLRVCHVNCQSLLAHFDEFRYFFSDAGYHVICMSETWLKPSVPDAMANLPGYMLLRCDRRERAGGGVGIYISDALSVSVLKYSDSSSSSGESGPEFIIVDVWLDGFSRLLLASVYRPPNIGHLQDFFNLFMELQINYRHSIIMGDFNADMNVISYDSQQVNTFVYPSSLFLVPYQATHNLRSSSSFIDLCI
ncbi:hypothetical protein RF55_22416, partial [Lasius niger]